MPRNARPGSPLVAVGYLRCSTSEQHLSPDAQRAQIEAFAAREGIQIVAWHSDIGVSGGADVTQRPALLSALSDLRVHGAGTLLVLRRDRLARDAYIALSIERAAAAAGARILTADGAGNGDDPSAVLLRGMLDLFASHERAMIKARTRAALQTKKARGECVGECPYGYSVDSEGKLIPNAGEQKVIALVKGYRAQGVPFRAIVKELERAGLTSRAGKAYGLAQVASLARAA